MVQMKKEKSVCKKLEAEKVMNAPDVTDNFYTNPMDGSCKGILALLL
jgi:hypothetical protein